MRPTTEGGRSGDSRPRPSGNLGRAVVPAAAALRRGEARRCPCGQGPRGSGLPHRCPRDGGCRRARRCVFVDALAAFAVSACGGASRDLGPECL